MEADPELVPEFALRLGNICLLTEVRNREAARASGALAFTNANALDPAADVKALVMSGAGSRALTPAVPFATLERAIVQVWPEAVVSPEIPALTTSHL